VVLKYGRYFNTLAITEVHRVFNQFYVRHFEKPKPEILMIIAFEEQKQFIRRKQS
jgi:hypothetical protein